jgi:hypothetical protein
MNIYSASSGNHDPNNDFFSLTIAMDAGAYSSIKVYESGGNGVIDYSTTSDYVSSITRKRSTSENIILLSASESSQTGYSGFLSWAPGSSISLLSSSDLLTTGRLDTFTDKASLNENAVVKSGKLIPSQYYDDAWTPSGHIQMNNLHPPTSPLTLGASPTGLRGSVARNTDVPFIISRNTDIATTGSFDLYASTLEGCVFQVDLRRNFSNNVWANAGSTVLPEKFGTTITNRTDKLSTLNEWNSIFAINDNCNAGTVFRNGDNRDTVFSNEMIDYLNKHWYGKLKSHLWGNAIDNTSVDLSSRDPETLRRVINYCFLYFGASDDIRNLGKVNYVNPWSFNGVGTKIRWHMGLGAPEPHSSQSRYLKKENTLLPPTNKYVYVHKVFGLPPRSAYADNITSDLNLVSFTGSFGDADGGASTTPGY